MIKKVEQVAGKVEAAAEGLFHHHAPAVASGGDGGGSGGAGPQPAAGTMHAERHPTFRHVMLGLCVQSALQAASVLQQVGCSGLVNCTKLALRPALARATQAPPPPPPHTHTHTPTHTHTHTIYRHPAHCCSPVLADPSVSVDDLLDSTFASRYTSVPMSKTT